MNIRHIAPAPSPDAPAAISVVPAGAGVPVDVLGAPIAIMSAGRRDQLFFVDHPVPDGYRVPLHVHEDEDELFYVLEGELTLESAAGEARARAGSFVHLPRGVAHGFSNQSGAPVRMLVVATPGGALEGVFRGLDAAARAGALDSAGVAAICADNRVRML
jgi:quercetin dioxygenase-like cupin family protein